MPELDIVESFADGQVLFEADLDNICNSLTDFFNLIGIDAANLQDSVLSQLIPTGTVVMYGSLTPPPGWLNCDGAAVSRSAFATLYGIVRTTFGSGDGSTTFNLPNFQRSIPVGQGGTAISGPANTIGSTGGEENHTLASDSSTLPGHGHSSGGSHTHVQQGSSVGGGGVTEVVAGGTGTDTTAANAALQTANALSTLDNTGGGGAHNNVQLSLVVNFIIKT